MKVAKGLFISRPRRNLQTFLQFLLQTSSVSTAKFPLPNSVKWIKCDKSGAKSGVFLLAVESSVKFAKIFTKPTCTWQTMCRTLQIMGVLWKSVQIPHGPDCAGVCSSTIHVHAVTL